MEKKFWFVFGVSFAFLAKSLNVFSAPIQPRWVFFDLGNTIVDTSDWNAVHYIPGSEAYLDVLKKRGHHLGLIVNFPDRMVKPGETKLHALKVFLEKTWDKTQPPFDWSIYEEVLVPETDAQRKPAPALFLEAVKKAAPEIPFYEGEVEEEINVARQSGMHAYQVRQSGKPFYLPVEEIESGGE